MNVVSLQNGRNKVLGAESLLNLNKVTAEEVRELDSDYLLKYRYFTIVSNGQESNWIVDENDNDTPENGGVCIVTNSGIRLKRNRINGQGYINTDWFGLKNDCVWDFNGISIPIGTDNTLALRKAISAVPEGGTLYIPYGMYLITDTIQIDKPFDIIAEKGTVLVGDISDKTKPILKVQGASRARYANFCLCSGGYQSLAGIQFHGQDSQAIELDNVKASQCRHGLYSDEAETINRILLKNCDFSSNAIAGFYLKSFDVVYGHSAPITFENTILNSNGPMSWMYNATYKGQPVISASDKFGYQLYAKGFGKLNWKGGQISNHGKAKNLAMAYLENGSGFSLYAPDFEDFTSACNRNGDLILPDYSNILNEDEGSAILIKSVSGVFAEMSHIFQIDSKSVFKLMYTCNDVTILNLPKVGNCKYTIDVAGVNESINTTRLRTNSDLSLLSSRALHALNKDELNLIESMSSLLPVYNKGGVFDVYNIQNQKYSFGYCLDTNNPNFVRNGLYKEQSTQDDDILFVELECTQGSFPSQGMFFIEALDSSNTRLGYTMTDTKGIYQYKNQFYKYFSYELPIGTKKIRYGFINYSDYVGYVPNDATVSALNIYSYRKNRSNSIKKSFMADEKIATIKQNIQFIDSPTVAGNFEKGVLYINSFSTNGCLGWICTKSGTNGVLNVIANGVLGNSFITINSNVGIEKGQYLNISNTSYKVLEVTIDKVYLSAALTSDVVNYNLVFSAPTMSMLDYPLEFITITHANYTPDKKARYVLLDATSNSIFVNLPDASQNAGRILEFKRIDNTASYVTLSGTIDYITYRLRYNEHVKIMSDGTNWQLMGSTGRNPSGSFTLNSGSYTLTNPQITANANIGLTVKSGTGTIPAYYDYICSNGSVTFYARKQDKTVETLCTSTLVYQILSY